MPRKEKTIHYIYKTTCKVTGRYYIGMHSASKLEDGYLGSGKRLRHSIRKHGKENHVREILESFETREQLIEREIQLITSELICDDLCMNLKGGGTGGGYHTLPQETKDKIIASSSKWLKEKWKDKEFRENQISLSSNRMIKMNESGIWNHKSFLNKTHSEETKKLMSESSRGVGIGNSNSQFGTCWVTRDGKNKKIKKEEIQIYLKNDWVKGRK